MDILSEAQVNKWFGFQGVLNALKHAHADMTNPCATGAMLALGHFDMDLPLTLSQVGNGLQSELSIPLSFFFLFLSVSHQERDFHRLYSLVILGGIAMCILSHPKDIFFAQGKLVPATPPDVICRVGPFSHMSLFLFFFGCCCNFTFS